MTVSSCLHSGNQKAQSRLVQIENGSEILGAIFTDLDLRRIESEGKTLEEVLGGRLKAAAAKLTDDSVGDAMVMAKLDSMLGKSLYSLGHFEESIDLFKKATAIRLKALGPDDRETLATQHNLAEGYVLAGKYDEAIRIHRQTLERTQAILGPTHVDTLASMKDLGNVYVAKGEIDTGVPLIAESLRLSRLTLEPESELILTGTNSLAVAYQYQREYARPCRCSRRR